MVDNKQQDGARNALNPSYAGVGLNTDATSTAIEKGALTFALNAMVESFSGESITYQNEIGNIGCVQFPSGYKVMGVKRIPEKAFTMYMLANPSTGNSQIGKVVDDTCEYLAIIDDASQSHKLAFSIEFPILQVAVKTTDCTTQVYWTDRKNPRRYLDFENLPWKEERNPNNDFKPTILTGQLDINKMLVQPNFSIPKVKATKEIVGGSLQMGTYQAAIQYSNSLGEGFTSFHNISNPFPIYENKPGQVYDLPTSKAIVYEIENLDTTGLYDYFNLAIVKTINDISSVDLVGKGLSITGSKYTFTYTGSEKSPSHLIPDDIFQKYKYYDTAKGLFEIDNILGWFGLASPMDLNYQEIWSSVELLWQTTKIPYNKFEGYNNGVNTQDYKGYMRDEVYAIEGLFVLRNGMETKSSHVPGRVAQLNDRINVPISNLDGASSLVNPCDTERLKERWQVYNTATKEGYAEEYINYTGDPSCYKGPYEYGKMAYWQSEKLYPNNPLIFGKLANQPIRHPKLPDSTITHIHDNTSGEQGFVHSIFPIGIIVKGLQEAIKNSSLTQAEKDMIVGFKIVRGNRDSNKSIIAKGLFNNVGKYTFIPDDGNVKESQTYYFPNYPFNDLRPDPYFTTSLVKDHSGYRPDARVKGFSTDDSRYRLTFHSPDTHFKQPFGVDSGQVKIETIEYGKSYGHFVPVDTNAQYLFINKNGYRFAYGGGIASVINGTVTYNTPWDYGIGASLAPANFAPTFTAMLEILQKILPYNNFGYSHNSYGDYNSFVPVPNEGNKIRSINYGKYILPQYENVEGGNIINNYQRESSLYVSLTEKLLFPHEYDPIIPEDNSRYTISSYLDITLWDKFFPVFNSNHALVQRDDILQAITSSTFQGPLVLVFNFFNQHLYSIPSIGDVYEYKDGLTGNVMATIEIIDEHDTQTGASYFQRQGYVTAIILSGSIDDVNNTVALQPQSTSLGAATVSFEYSNTNASYLNKVTGAAPINPFHFETITEGNYLYYIVFRTTALNNEATKIAGIYNTISSLAELEALNIQDPTTVGDFDSIAAYNAYILAFDRFQYLNTQKGTPDKVRESDICSYYGSIKHTILDQWGELYSYETIDTGYYQELKDDKGAAISSFPAVFGGDTFINRFALKTKLPIFDENTVGDEDQTNIEFDKIANLTYPMFWISTRPISHNSSIASYIEGKAKSIERNGATADAFQSLIAGIAAVEITFHILKELLSSLGIRNLNLDNFEAADVYEKGIMYLFVYGVPYFFVESGINVDHRQALNDREGDFYPNVAGTIPDEWLQEANVSIEHDNVYAYNDSYSKYNKENYFPHLRADFDPNKKCFFDYPNRAIWSEKSNLEETRDHWLTYKPVSYFDLPKTYGALTCIDGIENRQLLARFENRTQLYNALTTINLSQGPRASLNTTKLFDGAPLDLSTSESGHGGSQHILFIRTEYGNVYVDAVRGQVILLTGANGGTDIAEKGMDKWFASHTPFLLPTRIPGVPLDNAFNGIGLTGTYDALYKRIIITKKDFVPLVDNISYINGIFVHNHQQIALTDSTYFCDKSWTLSYSFITQSWISYHSYTPSYYVSFPNYFQSGNAGSLWEHNRSTTLFNSFNDNICPYILEYPIAYAIQDEIVQSIGDYCTALKYQDASLSYEPAGVHYFNKAVLYNRQQCTGILNLVPKAANNLATYGTFPKYNASSKDILVTKKDHIYRFNSIHDIQKSPSTPAFVPSCSPVDKELNSSALDYSPRAFKKPNLRAKDLKVRLILDNKSDIKLVSKFMLSPSTPSII